MSHGFEQCKLQMNLGFVVHTYSGLRPSKNTRWLRTLELSPQKTDSTATWGSCFLLDWPLSTALVWILGLSFYSYEHFPTFHMAMAAPQVQAAPTALPCWESHRLEKRADSLTVWSMATEEFSLQIRSLMQMKPYHSVDVLVIGSMHFHLPDHSAIASLHSCTTWISFNSFSYLIR